MAVTAREIIMVFRGQNYLSGAIRRVGTDVAGLTRRQQMQIQRGAIAAAQNRAALAKKSAEAELASVQRGGSRYMGLQNAMLSQQTSIARTRKMMEDNQNQILRRRITLRDAEAKMMRLQGAQAASGIGLAVRQRMLDQANTAAQIEAASKARAAAAEQYKISDLQVRHQAEMVELRRSELSSSVANTGILKSQLNAQEAGLKQIGVRQKELSDLEKLKRLRVLETNRALAMQNIQLAQADAMLATRRWQGFQQGARWVEHATRVIQMLGLIAGASFGYAAKTAADFNTQMTIAATQSTVAGHNTVAQVQKNAKQIGDAITQMMMAGKTIANPQELGQGIYDIFSGVTIPGDQQQQLKGGIALLKQFNDVLTANAGMVKFDEVVQAGITLINDFNVPIKEMPKNLNLMQAAVRYGRMTMSEFLSTFNQAAPAAKSAGYSFRDMADAITFLSRKFPSIRFAATGYARLVDILTRSREKFAAQGLTITDTTGKLLPLEDILAKISRRYPGVTTGAKAFAVVLKQITGMSGTMQASRVATFLLQDQQGFHKLSQQVNSDSNELTKSLSAAQKSTGVTWAEFVNQLRAIILQIGKEAIPAFQRMGKYVVDAVHWFDNLDPKWKHMIGYMGTIISLSALVGASIISVVSGFAALASGVIIWAKLRSAMRLAWKENAVVLAMSTRTVAANEGLIASEAGFISVSRVLTLGITGMAFAAIFYHKQVGQIISSMGGWRNVVLLVAGAYAVLNMQTIVRNLIAMTMAMRGLVGVGGLVLMVAAFTNFGVVADSVRKTLDFMFHSWVGYVVTVAALTAAVNELAKAFVLLGGVTKAQALWSGLSGFAATIAAIPANIRATKNLQRGLTAGGVFGRTASGRMGIPSPGPGGVTMLKDSSGRFIGRMAAPMGEAAVAGIGLRASLVGIGSALAGFLPMLAAGGILMGGLYLWKRHLDAVHAAQEKVRRTQAYINAVTRSDALVTQFRKYSTTLKDVYQAQLDYNDALRAYNEGVSKGVKGDELKRLILSLAQAHDSLANATTRSNSALSGFRQTAERVADRTKLTRIKNDISRLNELVALYAKGRSGQDFTAAEYKRFNFLTNIFDVADLNAVQKRIESYQKLLDLANKNISRSNRQFVAAIRSSVEEMINLKMLPAASKETINALSQWISKQKELPSLEQIRLRLRVGVAIDPNSMRRIPKQYMDAMIRIYNIIENTNRKLTKPQIKLLIRVLLGIDPNSKVGQQLQAIINSVVAGLRANLPAGTENAAASAFHHRDVLPVTIPRQPPPEPSPRQRSTARQALQVSTERKMWNQIQDIVKLHQRATTTGSYNDWQAYYKKLNGAQKSWKDTNLDVFNQMLDAQESSLNNSADKQVTTIKDMVSGVKGIYDNFLSQEQNIFGQLGQGPLMTSPMQQFRLQWGGKLTGMDYFNDLKKQFSSFASYHKQLTKLMKSGAPQGLIKEIMGMSPEDGRKMMEAMSQLGPQQLREYYNMYNKRQRIIEEYTKKDLKRQLDIYRKHGQNIAKAIIAGIQDENVALTKWMTNLVKTIFPGLPVNDTTKTGPPAPKQPPKYEPATKVVKPRVTHTASKSAVPVQHNETHTYHITTTGDPISVKNQIRHADLARRNRYTGRGPGPR